MPSDFNVAPPDTPRLSSSASPISRDGAERPPRFGVGVRLRTFLKRAKLDAALTDGADPGESAELALRARQLAKPRTRIRLARAIERAVDDVESPVPEIPLGVYRRAPVLENRALLRAAAERLRSEAPVRLRGVAMADLLVYCNDSALYGADSADQLEREITTVLWELEPEASVRLQPSACG
jgi:hypothetical protein